ncbi:MAG: hypothetical protein HUK02_06230 [Bacteroidaceae bacterium]|nr:hypothetical protein [Bacteroidaceae bacterium]
MKKYIKPQITHQIVLQHLPIAGSNDYPNQLLGSEAGTQLAPAQRRRLEDDEEEEDW